MLSSSEMRCFIVYIYSILDHKLEQMTMSCNIRGIVHRNLYYYVYISHQLIWQKKITLRDILWQIFTWLWDDETFFCCIWDYWFTGTLCKYLLHILFLHTVLQNLLEKSEKCLGVFLEKSVWMAFNHFFFCSRVEWWKKFKKCGIKYPIIVVTIQTLIWNWTF